MSLSFNESNKSSILTISKWSKFFSILGFIFSVLMILGGLGILLASSFLPLGDSMPFDIRYLAIFYILFSLLYFFVSMMLYKSSNGFKQGIQNESQDNLDLGFSKLANLFKIQGYLTIAILILYFLMIIGMVIFGFSKAASMKTGGDQTIDEISTEELEGLDSVSSRLDTISVQETVR